MTRHPDAGAVPRATGRPAGSASLGGDHDAYLRRRHFGSLDGLRALCIGAVLWHHSPLMDPASPVQLLTRGFTGVDMFFVLSGFLITTLLLREERSTGAISLSAFYRRRAFRILPGYLLLLTAMSVCWIGIKGQHQLAPLVPYYLLFLSNFLTAHIPLMTITWSLSVEEQFYLVWPLTMVLLPFLARRRIALLLCIITLFLAVALGAGANLPRVQTAHAVFALPVMSYTALLSGALAALLLNQRRGYRLLSTICGYSGAPVVFLGLLLVWLQVSPENLKSWPGEVMYVLMALLLVSLVVREDNALRPVLTLAPIRRIGEISYGVYLFHLIGLHIAHETVSHLVPAGRPANCLMTLLYVPVSLLIAEISFRTFEHYFLSLKKRRTGRRHCVPA